MKIHFLGTAASEGIPNPFCRCEYCQQARIRKGKDIRTHSSAIIDDQLLIDVAPEF
ncbi:carbon-phosphorus lyase, partial [Klebsiella pneumoniae]|nr:carbon-phosphorus lyase [Klebsiella pneumoniae]